MHEVAVAMELVRLAQEHAEGATVHAITIDIGALSCVSADALRFAFEVAASGTRAEGARLDIERKPALARCRGCAQQVELDQPFGRCGCGSGDLEFLGGDELRVRQMEVS